MNLLSNRKELTRPNYNKDEIPYPVVFLVFTRIVLAKEGNLEVLLRSIKRAPNENFLS